MVGGEPCHRTGEPGGYEIGRQAEPHPAVQGLAAHLLDGLAVQFEHALRLVQQGAASLVEHQRTAAAVEQLGPHLSFEPLDLQAAGRLWFGETRGFARG